MCGSKQTESKGICTYANIYSNFKSVQLCIKAVLATSVLYAKNYFLCT